jgi:hypothetical protein
MSTARGGSDRVTEAFWRAPSGQGSINRLVFTRDAPLGIVPIGGRSDARPDFAVRIDGDGAAERAIVSFLGRERDQRWLTEAVCDFIEEVAKLLAEYGEADYELVTPAGGDGTDVGDSEDAAGAIQRHLELIPPRSLHAIGPLVVQVVPRDKTTMPRRIRVPTRKVFRIRLPKSFGTPRSHRRMLRRLDKVEHASRRFITATAPTSVPMGYDHRVAQRASESEVLRLTRRWGVLPFLEPKDMTGYFVVAGAAYHRRAQTILRDHIIDRLNALLRTENLQQVRIEGLPSVAGIDRTLAELAAGTIDLKEALEATRF